MPPENVEKLDPLRLSLRVFLTTYINPCISNMVLFIRLQRLKQPAAADEDAVILTSTVEQAKPLKVTSNNQLYHLLHLLSISPRPVDCIYCAQTIITDCLLTLGFPDIL